MLTRPRPPWVPFADEPTIPYRRRRRARIGLAERTRWLWLLPLIGGFLAVLGWVVTHDPGPGLTDRAWVTLALAAGLVVLLTAHRYAGLRRLLRILAEYVVVALLAVLLTTAGTRAPADRPTPPAASATTTTPTRPHARPPATTAPNVAGAARCPDPSLAHAPSWLSCVWHRAMDPAPTPPPTTRRHP